jgi:hypothetical protein
MNVSPAEFKAAMISFQHTGERPTILDSIPAVLPRIRRTHYQEYVDKEGILDPISRGAWRKGRRIE